MIGIINKYLLFQRNKRWFYCLITPIKALPSKYLLVLKTSSTSLQRNNFTSSKTSWRRLEDVLEDEKLLRWRRLQDVLEDEKLLCWRRLEDVLKTCLKDVLKACLEDVLNTCLEVVLKTYFEDVLKTL